MYSLIETAKENGINPYEYLVWVLKAASEMGLAQNPELAEQLLPGCGQITESGYPSKQEVKKCTTYS